MFEDLIIDKNKKIDQKATQHQCKNCKSTSAETDGLFVPGGYTETVVCKSCGTKWIVNYDTDLNIINIKCGG